jgi:uncharacterized protein (TIGR00369 family)
VSVEFPEDAAELLQSYIDGSEGFLSRMGAEVVELTRDRTRLRLEYNEGVANATQRQWLHGGAIATLVDSAGGLAVRPYLDSPVRDGVATVSLNVDYLSAATDDVVADAEVLRVGGTVGFSRVEVEELNSNEGDKVAVGRGSYRLFTNEE